MSQLSPEQECELASKEGSSAAAEASIRVGQMVGAAQPWHKVLDCDGAGVPGRTPQISEGENCEVAVAA